MENFKSKRDPTANVVIFDGLSIPQEDIYKSPSLLHEQSLSNLKFFKTYENGFKNIKVNKSSLPINNEVQLEKQNLKDHPRSSFRITSVQKFNENSDASTNCSKMVALTTKEELNKCNTLPDQTKLWNINGKITDQLANTFVSSSSLVNQSVLSEDAYFYKVDPSKLVLTDIDYIWAKCRWNYKNISDYAFNPKAMERIRYLDMFTQCFSLRNVENNYNNMDNELTSSENITSEFGEGDNFDIYKKQMCIIYDTSKVIHNYGNIAERENYVNAKKENTNSVFQSNIFNPSIPNIHPSANLPSSDTPKNPLQDTLINFKFDRNNSKFKALIPEVKNSRKSCCNTNAITKKCSKCSSSNINKKSKSRFTTSSVADGRFGSKDNFPGTDKKYFSGSTDKLKNEDYYLEKIKSDCHSNDEMVNNIKIVTVSEKDIGALTKSQNSRNNLFKDEGTQYKKTDYEQANNFPEKEENRNSFNVLSTLNKGTQHKSKNSSLSRNGFENMKKIKQINYCAQESNHKKTTRFTSAEKLNEIHERGDDYSEKPNESTFCDNNLPTDGKEDDKMEQHTVKYKKTPEKCLRAKYARNFDDISYDDENIFYNRKNYASRDEKFEESLEGSEFTVSTCSSLEWVTAENTELMNKYFLNEFIMGVLKTDKKGRKIKLHSNKNKPSLSSKTTFISSSSAFVERNEIGNIMLDVNELCQECKTEEESKGEKLNKECSHNCYKLNENKNIIVNNDANNSRHKNCSYGVRQMHSTKHFQDANEHFYYTRNQLKSKKVNEDSGRCTEQLNSSCDDSKLTTILEGSGGKSEPYEIRLRILGTSDSINKTGRKLGIEESSSNFRQTFTKTTSQLKADLPDFDIKNKISASSINGSSESSMLMKQDKTKKIKKLKKRKVKKHQHKDSRKCNDNTKIRREERKQTYTKTEENARNQSSKDFGQNVYIGCWKKYCTIL